MLYGLSTIWDALDPNKMKGFKGGRGILAW
jgi:hypothetical protein